MGISNVHNLRTPPVESLRPYGLRVSLPSGDPLRKLLGPEWHRLHWYATPQERDADMVEMSRRHEYSRASDAPSLRFGKSRTSPKAAVCSPRRLLEGTTEEQVEGFPAMLLVTRREVDRAQEGIDPQEYARILAAVSPVDLAEFLEDIPGFE